LDTTEDDFRAICVLSGCDFQEETWPLTECFERFYRGDEEFGKRRKELKSTIDIFCKTDFETKKKETTVNLTVLREILQQEGFLFNLS
jgi:hypothetical protein